MIYSLYNIHIMHTICIGIEYCVEVTTDLSRRRARVVVVFNKYVFFFNTGVSFFTSVAYLLPGLRFYNI